MFLKFAAVRKYGEANDQTIDSAMTAIRTLP